jgi:site-specific recombinase XerD
VAKLAQGIYRRGTVYWFAIQRDGHRRHVSLKTDDLSLAVTRAAAVKKQEWKPTDSNFKGLSASVAKYLASKTITTKHSPSTNKWATRALKQFSANIKCSRVSEITEDHVAGFYGSLRKRKKPNGKMFSENSAHSYLRAVRGFLSWAVTEKLCFDNPGKVKFGKPSQPARIKCATITERDCILQNAQNDSIKFVLFCTFHAGMRFNEVVQARPDWFNLEAGYITIQKTDSFTVKNRKNRTVPLSSPFKQFLKEYGLRSPFMLEPKRLKGKEYRYDFRVPWDKSLAIATAKLKETKPHANLCWITPHLARHTFASILAQQGVSIYKIAEWIGDTIEVCTRHYAHLAPSDNTIDALLGDKLPPTKKKSKKLAGPKSPPPQNV